MVSSLALQGKSKTNVFQENALREFSHNSLFQAPSLRGNITFPFFSLTTIGNNKIARRHAQHTRGEREHTSDRPHKAPEENAFATVAIEKTFALI